MEKNKIDLGFWVAMVLLIVMWLMFIGQCHAQKSTAVWDTIPAKYTAIRSFVEKRTPKTVRIYAVYKDEKIEDIIFVPKGTYEYLQLCKKNGLWPNIAIRLRNREVYSIIQLKKKL